METLLLLLVSIVAASPESLTGDVDDHIDCGFGHAVYANGTYIRTSREECC
jgi:hypothetical protein